MWEANTLFSVYDTLFATNPVAPNQVYCNMCQTVTPSVVGGNQEFTVTLRQNLRWQDGVPVDAFDIKFSLLTLRDEASNFSGGLLELLDVQVLSSSTLTITMRGQSVSHLLDLASPPIIPRHLWECPPNGQSAVSGFGPCNPSFYGDVGEADPGKVDPSYDPLAAGTFIGSGPFACLSVFPIDRGRLGTGCASNSDGSRAGQAISGTMTLTRYDFTGRLGATDPFAQWFRNNNPSWGTGSNSVAAESGQLQEFLWADRYDNGVVTILDLNSVASCVGRSSNGGPCTDYAYWNRPALHPATPTVVSNELAIVATHLDDEWINPYAWSSSPPSDATSGPMFNIAPMPTTCSSPGNPSGCYP